MKLLIITIVILFLTVSSGAKHAFAETPLQLDKDLQKQGITSPLPTATNTQQSANYYPDYRLPEQQTRILIIGGVFLILTGTVLLTPISLLIARTSRKRPTIIMPNVVLR